VYPKVSGLSHNEVNNNNNNDNNIPWEATQRVMAAELTRLTHWQRSLPFGILASGGQSGNFWIYLIFQTE
jgi:hypothetical protein